jgi:hypothetical protein
MKTFHPNVRRFAVRALALVSLAVVAHATHAESVFRCRAADGAVAFQDHPCSAGAATSVVEIAPSPKFSPSPAYGVEHGDRVAHAAHERGSAPRGRHENAHEPMSYECRAANGDVFYRHAACPKQIGKSGGSGRSRGRGGASDTIAVSGEALPRGEACRRMASGVGRSGRDRDETVSSYDKNLGRDPCRRL